MVLNTFLETNFWQITAIFPIPNICYGLQFFFKAPDRRIWESPIKCYLLFNNLFSSQKAVFSFSLGSMSSFFCSFFSVFQMNFFLSLRKKHYHNLFLFPLPPLTFSVYLYFYLLVPIQCIFIIVSLFLLSLSPPFPLLCPCSTSIEIRRKYFHLTREEQIERALCIKKVF